MAINRGSVSDTVGAVSAATSEQNALTHANDASTSATAAANSAAAAATSEANASSSASSASSSASSATSSASTATTQASNAATSATNAADSATAAAASAASLTVGISEDNILQVNATVVDNDFLRIDGVKVEGRSASEVLSDIGGQASLTHGIANTNTVKIDSSSVADDEYARFTASGLESRSTSEVLSDIGGQASLTFGIANTNAVKIDSSSVADDEYARFTANGLESRSTSEVLSDIGGQSSLTFGISNTNAVKIDSASVADDEYARFTANGLESREASEVRGDIGLGTAAVLDTGISNTNVPKFTSGVSTGDFLKVNGTEIEGRSASEVLSDIGASAGFINNKNLLINGGMNVWQRSTSATGITSSGYHSADRLYTYVNNHGTYTMARSTTVPTGQGFGYSWKIDCTIADTSLAANAHVMLAQVIEGQNLQRIKKGTSSADSLTLSFWIRSNLTGTLTAELYDTDNTRQISQTFTISSADTWEKKEITFAGDTTGAFNNDNGASLYFEIHLAAGSDLTSGTLNTSWASATSANRVSSSNINIASSTSNELLLTGIQLEQGTAATDFEFEPYDMVLQKCQRYLYMSQEYGAATSLATATNDIATWHTYLSAANMAELANFHFPVTMRANPTITVSSQSGTIGKISERTSGGGAIADVDAHSVSSSKQTVRILEYAEQSYGLGASVKADAEL
jgi:hypothetical protein